MNTFLLPDLRTACPKSHFSGTDTDNNFTVSSVSVMKTVLVKFNVLLTVHHAMILGNCPT